MAIIQLKIGSPTKMATVDCHGKDGPYAQRSCQPDNWHILQRLNRRMTEVIAACVVGRGIEPDHVQNYLRRARVSRKRRWSLVDLISMVEDGAVAVETTYKLVRTDPGEDP